MDLMQNEKFNTMKARVVHRDVVTPTLNEITSQHPKLWWLEQLEKEMVGCAPILHLDEVFADPHAPLLQQWTNKRQRSAMESRTFS